jgi:hypothetical protein
MLWYANYCKCVLVRQWPSQGSRYHAFLALAGVLARAQWSVEDAKTFHRVMYQCLWQANADPKAADSEVQSTFDKYSADGEITGLPTLRGLLDRRVVDKGSSMVGHRADESRIFVRTTPGTRTAWRTCTGMN